MQNAHTDRQIGHHRHRSDAVVTVTVMIHACKAHDSAFVVNFHVTNFMLHPNFWRMSTSCSLCHRKMAQLSLRWALLHSFGLFTLLFGLMMMEFQGKLQTPTLNFARLA